jgi:hypothetical protein
MVKVLCIRDLIYPVDGALLAMMGGVESLTKKSR